jgi:hypothetical protein
MDCFCFDPLTVGQHLHVVNIFASNTKYEKTKQTVFDAKYRQFRGTFS